MVTKIVGDKALRMKIARLSNPAELVPTVEAVAVEVKGAISKYPDGNQHRPQPFKSARQRAYFFWALKEGLIEVPYRRGQSPGSEDLGQSWTVKGMKGGLQQIIGNDTSYGQLVQGPDTQTAYHAETGWKTTDEVIEEKAEKALREIQKRVDQLLAG